LQLAGLTQVCFGGGEIVCVGVSEAQPAKLFEAPPEDVNVLHREDRGLGGWSAI